MNNINYWLVKIDRVFAWILFVSVLFYFLTGYGMTKELINGSFATKLHLEIMPIIMMMAFAIHSGLAIRLAFIRWRIWNKGTMIFLILFYFTFLFGFGYIEIFYKKSPPDVDTTNPIQNLDDLKTDDDDDKSTQETKKTTIPIQDTSNNSQKTFTISELAKYNGQNGMSAYVAVDGVVYDVTQVFLSGKHYTHFAGQELTNAFYLRHAKSAITKYPAVGILK